MNRFEHFSEEEKRMLVEAIWRRQKCFIAGDRQFRAYGAILDELAQDTDYSPGKFL